MTASLALLLALACSDSAKALEPQVETVSIFKNGYVVATRRMRVPAAGIYHLQSLPSGAMGTVWFRTSAGTILDGVKALDVATEEEANLGSLEEILQANIGKDLRIVMRVANENLELTGKLRGSVNDILVLDTASGRRVVRKEGVREVSSTGGDLIYTVKRKGTRRVLQFTVSGKGGDIWMMSLERGISWAPAYAVDTTDKKELSLVAKATLINDLVDLRGAEAKLITGFPHIPYASILDPLLTGNAARFEAMEGSGFGGGRGAMEKRALGVQAQAPAEVADFAEAMAPSGGSGEQLEDLFFYRLPKVDLGSGQRSYQILFQMKSPYKDVYTWDIADTTVNNVEYRGIPEGPQDVWHALRFKNTSGQPLTSGVATTFDKGEIVGQDMLGYTPAGAETELKVNKSLDIRAEGSESEIDRERGAIKNRDGYPVFDKVTIEGTLQITNMKPVAVETRITRNLTGELVKDPEQAQALKTAVGLTQANPTTRITWKPTLQPGEKKKLVYVYQIFVRSQG